MCFILDIIHKDLIRVFSGIKCNFEIKFNKIDSDYKQNKQEKYHVIKK